MATLSAVNFVPVALQTDRDRKPTSLKSMPVSKLISEFLSELKSSYGGFIALGVSNAFGCPTAIEILL